MRLLRSTVCFFVALASLSAHALQTTSVSPQGEVSQVRQVVVTFDEAAVPFGDPKAAAPFGVGCSDALAAKGQGRWLNERRWVFDFADDLPPGVRCALAPVPGFASPKGAALKTQANHTFNTGGPFVKRSYPSDGAGIDEDQFFALVFNGAATADSVLASAWCSVAGLGERVPVRAVQGEERAAYLKFWRLTEADQAKPLSIHTLACGRTLSSGSSVALLVDPGVMSVAAKGQTGIPSAQQKRVEFTVRDAFKAEFTCERENAQANCLPLRALRLEFNATVSAQQLSRILLKTKEKTFAPTLPNSVDATKLEGEGMSVSFGASTEGGLLPEETTFTLELPPGFEDVSGRKLVNSDNFPLAVATAAVPPLAKFSAAPFGIVERLAEPSGLAALPVTLRKVEANLQAHTKPAAASPGQVSSLQPSSDADIIAWWNKLNTFDSGSVSRKRAAQHVLGPLPPVIDKDNPDQVETRMLSLLQGREGVTSLALPRTDNSDPRPFEVVGIPMQPGFHVVEIRSPMLGASLLNERYGDNREMVVRTSALVTNLGVHFKLGRENAMAWVTTLDKGKPVADAAVQVSDCRGKAVANGRTNAQGMVRFEGVYPKPPVCDDEDSDGLPSAYFVSARASLPAAADAGKNKAMVQDLAFTWSDWNRGIEPWRFNLPTSQEPQPDTVAHTVFDRSLLRLGETVSMKHLLRTQTAQGLALSGDMPRQLRITHVGSGQQYTQDLAWRKTPTGGQSAASSFAIPPAAKLGQYNVELINDRAGNEWQSGEFRVEAFRLPVLKGHVAPTEKTPLINTTELPVAVNINYVAGGAAAKLPVRVSALLSDKTLGFEEFPDFSFRAPRAADEAARPDNAGDSGDENDGGNEEHPNPSSSDRRVVADKLPLTLDATGNGQVTIEDLAPSARPRGLLLEATFADPNGEVQTLRSTHTLWPAGVLTGIRTEGWVSSQQKMKFQALALDLQGKPKAGVPLEVKAVARNTTSTRKRMVGGFYTYDNQNSTRALGTVCSGNSDARGRLLCETSLKDVGEVELVVTARDEAGHSIQAASSVWVTRQGELWFGGEEHDRMDLLPEKKSYQPGQTARLQVRMPFRFATALVTVEREGVLHSEVVHLNGTDPTVELKVQDHWGPNVYVSVLALRGRIRDVPWYSFFTWGYQAPREWWRSYWVEGREYVAPTALVDLSKPAYRMGTTEIGVGVEANELAVTVSTDQPSYPIRSKAQVTVTVKLPNGQPAANAEVAIAAVDQALLELQANTSWYLLNAMWQRRDWGVETSTAQMEIIGRRHYGRKAVPPGGGGGNSAARELFDTLLYWQPAVKLDANGQAKVTVPINDALTSFQIVAVADASTGLFGTGWADIRSTQDLQIISGLPPLVREGDQFRAQVVLRNTTEKSMRVVVTPKVTLMDVAPQTVDIHAGESKEVAWEVTAPAQLANSRAEALLWEINAKDANSGASDALKVSQRTVPAVPLAVQQATLVQVDGPLSLTVAPPAEALPDRGGVKLAFQPTLASGLPGVRAWFANYPYSCLEQKTSKAIGMRDAAAWKNVVAELPSYLDADGLASYFPPREGQANSGSDTLTAYLLAASHEAAGLDPAFALSDEARAPLEAGLIAFVEGRLKRAFWSPRADLEVRKLAAIEALSRHGKAQARMADSLNVAPNQWPTHAVIDWINILKRLPSINKRDQRLTEAMQVLRARISYQGSKLVFSSESDDQWWWLMQNGDVNNARLILTVLDDPTWKDDMGRLASGFIGRQQGGAWHTTTANLWGGLALEKFSAKFEAQAITGTTRASLGKGSGEVEWAKVKAPQTTDAAGAPHANTAFGAPGAAQQLLNNSIFLAHQTSGGGNNLSVNHQGNGKPWLTLQSLAAVPLKAPFASGYAVTRSVTPVEQANPALPAGSYTRGDVLRISLEVNASADMSWVVLSDPVPGGASILGNGLGRDSVIATQNEPGTSGTWPAFEERSFEAFRSYHDFMPKGTAKQSYTIRLNNVGTFALPPTRVEAMYAPEVFGEAPNAPITVVAPK